MTILAINGGKKTRELPFPDHPIIGKEEKKAVNDIFDEGGVLFAHAFEKLRKKFHIREFEKNSEKYFKVKHCLAVSSGTAALKISFLLTKTSCTAATSN